MRILRAQDHRRMPWKNGGGVTREIAVFPEAAGLDEFLWRVSMAEVSSDGPFSAFPGIDRTLTVIDGAGLRLSVDGAAPVELTPASLPCAFAADRAAMASLAAGPVTDINVMTRRGSMRHTVARMQFEGDCEFGLPADTSLVFCVSGSAVVSFAVGDVTLDRHDCLILGKTVALRARANMPCELLTVSIEACA